MKQIFILFITLFSINSGITAQKYYTKNGHIAFFSKASLENIKADNNQVLNVLNSQNGELKFSLLIKNFHFTKSLMEVHFNENYMESNRYPNAEFKGTITNLNDISFHKDGVYTVSVTGEMTIHGVVKKINPTGIITITGGEISLKAKFFIKLSDYNISIPKVVIDKIAESVEVTVHSNFDKKM